MTDTEGLLLRVIVHPANVQDRAAVPWVLEDIEAEFPRLKVIWADSGYNGKGRKWVQKNTSIDFQIVTRPYHNFRGWWVAEGQPVPPPPPKGFQVVKRRWVVERTFGWIGRNRQLSKEYDTNSEHTVAWMYLAMTRLMLRRLTNNIDHGYNSRAEISKVVAK